MSVEGPFNGLFAQQGWQCPICKRVYSPFTSMCYYCGNSSSESNITYAEKPFAEVPNQILNDSATSVKVEQILNDTAQKLQKYKEKINASREAESK